MIGEIILSHWQHKSRAPSGWISGNSPCCHHRGETRDTRHRGGIKKEPDGSVIFNCFNCKFTASWKPGRKLSQKMQLLLGWVGVPQDQIRDLAFKMWAAAQRGDTYSTESNEFMPWTEKFETVKLPSGAKPLSYWIENPSDKFIKVLEYFSMRDPKLIMRYDFYYSENMAFSKSFIIPFHYNGKIVGYASRRIQGVGPKYLVTKPKNFLFNADILQHDRKVVIVVEGILDAVNIDGISPLGSTLSEDQVAWLNNSDKEIILVPDLDSAGKTLIDVALKNKWSVSIPQTSGPNKMWDTDIKDVSDAVARYGIMYTMHSIMESKTDNPMEIQLLTEFNIA